MGRGLGITVGVEVILLDVGNTLLHVPQDPHERALRAVGRGDVPLERYKRGLEQAQREWWAAGGAPSSEDLPETWVAHIARALELTEFDGDRVGTARLIEESFLLDGWEVFPEAEDVLREASGRGVRLGVVSNWPPTLEASLEAAGLARYFEVIVASGAVGYAKPHSRIFERALAHLVVMPDRALFVGDSIELDVKGAAAVGMRAVLLDRERRFRDCRHERIEALPELLRFL